MPIGSYIAPSPKREGNSLTVISSMSHLLRSFIRTAYPPSGSSRSIHTRHSVRKLHTNKRQTPKPQILERVPINPRSCVRVRSTYTRMVSILINSLSRRIRTYSIISITSTPPFPQPSLFEVSSFPHHPLTDHRTLPTHHTHSTRSSNSPPCNHRKNKCRPCSVHIAQNTPDAPETAPYNEHAGASDIARTRRSGLLPPLLTVSPCFLSSCLPSCPIVVFIPRIARAKSHARKCMFVARLASGEKHTADDVDRLSRAFCFPSLRSRPASARSPLHTGLHAQF